MWSVRVRACEGGARIVWMWWRNASCKAPSLSHNVYWFRDDKVTSPRTAVCQNHRKMIIRRFCSTTASRSAHPPTKASPSKFAVFVTGGFINARVFTAITRLYSSLFRLIRKLRHAGQGWAARCKFWNKVGVTPQRVGKHAIDQA